MNIYTISTDDISYRELEPLVDTLPEEIRQKIKAYKKEPDKVNRVCGWRLLVQLLGQEEIDIRAIKRNSYGKPIFDSYHFSLSYTDGMVLVGTSREGAIGVDIEKKREIDKSEYLSILHPNEVAAIADKKVDLLDIWCRKESILKCYGSGLHNDMHELDTTQKSPLFKRRRFSLQDIGLGDDYHGTVATQVNLDETLNFKEIMLDSLFKIEKNSKG